MKKLFSHFAIVLALVGVFASPAQAIENTNSATTVVGFASEPAFSLSYIETYRAIASELNVPLGYAVSQYWPQEEFSRIATQIEASDGHGWVSAEFVPGGEVADGIITLTHVPTEAQKAIAAHSSLTVTFLVSHGPSALVLDRATARFAAVLEGKFPGKFYSLSTNYGEGKVGIELEGFNSNEIKTVEVIAKQFLGVLHIDVDLASIEGGSQELESRQVGTVTGGKSLSGSLGGCTAAFVVSDSVNWGISTADHCFGAVYYDGFFAGQERRSELAEGDVSWFVLDGATASDVTSTFQSNWGVYTTVQSVVNPVLNQYICKFGLTSGRSCGTVFSLSTTGNGYQKLIALSTFISQAGDSGAPFFSGTTAVGILSGYTTISGQKRTQLTRISAVNLLNAHIVTPTTP
jgi:hypothetical protein